MDQETKSCSGRRASNDSGGRIFRQSTYAKSDPGDGDDARSEAVHVVDQVDRVHQADDPEDGDEIRERLEFQDLDADTAEEERGRDDRLARELRGWSEPAKIVEQPERESAEQT